MKFFVPAVGYRIKLIADWSFKLYHEHRNTTLYEALTGREFPNIPFSWSEPEIHEKAVKESTLDAKLETGTVLEVDRVYVRTMNKSAQSVDDDYDSLTFKVVEHPTLKGKKRQLRFWAKLDDVNVIEYELPVDHMAGKDKARENAKKPKKLTLQTIREVVYRGISSHGCGKGGFYPIPAWLTPSTIRQFTSVTQEYLKLRDPFDKARGDSELARRKANLEHQLANRSLSLPIAFAHKVKTIDDLIKYQPNYAQFLAPTYPPTIADWHHVIPYNVMSGCGEGSRKFEKTADNRRCRIFRPDPPLSGHWDAGAPDMTHLWIRVYTDEGDFNVIAVEAGIDVR